ncbi:hypothetical protein [uncultured Senegalimassilia sp.]|nr:hypothetical protein [uncultured Senegalimassilia sp.]
MRRTSAGASLVACASAQRTSNAAGSAGGALVSVKLFAGITGSAE